MSENARDTQFRGFASRLFDDLPWNEINIDMERKGWEERWEAFIAQRAYDLACHVASHTVLTAHGDMSKIPDLTTWPEVAK